MFNYSIQTGVLKCNLWHHLQRGLKPLESEHALRILNIRTYSGRTDRLIYSCTGKLQFNYEKKITQSRMNFDEMFRFFCIQIYQYLFHNYNTLVFHNKNSTSQFR